MYLQIMTSMSKHIKFVVSLKNKDKGNVLVT